MSMTSSGLGIGIFEDPGFYEALGRAIKVVRAQRGLSRRHLAELAELSYPYLSEIENGKKRPSSNALLSIADALALPASELLGIAERIATRIPMAAEPDRERQLAGPARESSVPAAQVAPSAAPQAGMSSGLARKLGTSSSTRLAAEALFLPVSTADEPASSPRTAPKPDDQQGDPKRRQKLQDRLARAADRLTIEDLERVTDLAERLDL
jgi:transcriptional regulator with XRE-family HTH domain